MLLKLHDIENVSNVDYHLTVVIDSAKYSSLEWKNHRENEKQFC